VDRSSFLCRPALTARRCLSKCFGQTGAPSTLLAAPNSFFVAVGGREARRFAMAPTMDAISKNQNDY